MKNDWLFPNRYRRLGWFLFIPAALLGLIIQNVGTIRKLVGNDTDFFGAMSSYTDEVAALGIIAGLLLIAFAREKTEDEMIRQLRLEALQWSVYINYFLLALAIVLVYDLAFFTVLVYNMFTVLLVFIVRFRWSLKRVGRAEEIPV